MARDENPPFPRGQTAAGGSTIDTTQALPGNQWYGKEWVFEDRDPTAFPTAGTPRSNRYVRCRVVKNASTIAVSGRRLAQLNQMGDTITGYANTLAGGNVYPIDEYLPSGGCPVNDACYVVTEGPAVFSTAVEGITGNNFAAGARLVAATAAASTGTSAGRVVAQDLTGATAVLAAQIQNQVAVAVSAMTTGQTGADVLAIVAPEGW